MWIAISVRLPAGPVAVAAVKRTDVVKRRLSRAGALCRGFPTSAAATTAVEFGIVAPFLFAILFGMIGFGTQYAARIALVYAASEGGRAAVGGLSNHEREILGRAAINSSLTAFSPLVDVNKANVDFVFTQESNDEKVSITITYSDTRFAHLPFIPDLTTLTPVTVDYYVTDPSG
jgi:Flp pilus assembly protein TadG